MGITPAIWAMAGRIMWSYDPNMCEPYRFEDRESDEHFGMSGHNTNALAFSHELRTWISR